MQGARGAYGWQGGAHGWQAAKREICAERVRTNGTATSILQYFLRREGLGHVTNTES